MQKIGKVLTGGTAKKPKVAEPVVKPVASMPDEDTVRRNAMAQIARRKSGGRADTILTEDEKFG
jgi:hypothetical protein